MAWLEDDETIFSICRLSERAKCGKAQLMHPYTVHKTIVCSGTTEYIYSRNGWLPNKYWYCPMQKEEQAESLQWSLMSIIVI